MVIYLVRKYVAIWVVLFAGLAGFLLFFLKESPAYIFPRVVFWCGLLAPVQLWLEFKRKMLWPLYDNLKISRTLLLGLSIVLNVLLATGLRMWLR